MKSTVFTLLLAGYAALSPCILQAELKLATPLIEVNPKAEEEVVNVSFNFENTGDRIVSVLDVVSGCDCLDAELDAASYAPGAKGTGTAKFKVSSFVGRHEKAVVVHTDDPKQSQWVIPFLLYVPEVISIEPKTLQWWLGEKAETKTCVLKILGDEPVKILSVTSTRESVAYQLEEITPGREYRITVTPENTDSTLMGALRIKTDSKIPKYQNQLAFFSVYRKPASKQ